MASEPLTQEQIDAYAELTTDRNPLHVDLEFARRSRFGGTIAHGFLMLGGVLDLVDESLDAPALECRFHRPAKPGDRLEVRGASDLDTFGAPLESGCFIVLIGDDVCASGRIVGNDP